MKFFFVCLVCFLISFVQISAYASMTCTHGLSHLWGGENPARVLAQKLEPTFKHIKIDRARIAEVVKSFELAGQKLEISEWNYPPYLQSDDPIQLTNFLLVMNSNNFSFFDPKSGRPFQSGRDSGSTLATKRLVEVWPQISNPDYLRNISVEYVRDKLFAADVPVSLVEARTRVLREAGDFIFTQGPGGTFKWIQSLQTREAGPIAVSIPTFLPTWRDPFYKRSQLFLGMLYGRFQKRADNPIDRNSLNQLTVFADYRLPQTLRAMNVLLVANDAEALIEKGAPIIPGSEIEIELRAASILAADFLVAELNRSGKWGRVSVLEVDYLLWSVGRALTKGLEMPGVLVRGAKEHQTISTDY